ncbi:MAG: aspartyl protease family protein [Pyrinomonadaceae bacterium]
MLQVTLFGGTTRKQVICLVDSGADVSLFHASIGRNLGIEIESGTYKEFEGIAGNLEAYMHDVELQIQDFAERVQIVAGFTESEGVDAILGQTGFFENYRICFDLRRAKMEISSR